MARWFAGLQIAFALALVALAAPLAAASWAALPGAPALRDLREGVMISSVAEARMERASGRAEAIWSSPERLREWGLAQLRLVALDPKSGPSRRLARAKELLRAATRGAASDHRAWYGLAKEPTYTANALLAIDARSLNVLDAEAVLAGVDASNASLQTQIEVMGSRSFARDVVDAMGLADDPEFSPRRVENDSAIGFVHPSIAFLGDVLSSNVLIAVGLAKDLVLELDDPSIAPRADARRDGVIDASAAPTADEPPAGAYDEAVVDAFLTRLNVGVVGRPHVISLSFTAKDPVKAARIASFTANAYVARALDEQVDAARLASA